MYVSNLYINSGSTGADGPFSPTSTVTLQLPADGTFHYTTINIPAGVTVKFTRNAANTPVTLLATGNVTIAGTIDISGTAGATQVSGTSVANNAGVGGAGGFDGGLGSNGLITPAGGSGLGPGGGSGGPAAGQGAGGAGFLTAGPNSWGVGGPAYGTPTLLPLIGGSGGGGRPCNLGCTGSGGGGGGGAILIASSGSITFTGSILAKGGNGGGYGAGGSGGAVRLVATTILGSGGSINVLGGTGPVTTSAVPVGWKDPEGDRVLR